MITHKLRRSINIPTVELVLTTDKSLVFDNSAGLRGFIGRHFSEDVLLHNHNNDEFIYSYPRIQYKIIDNKAYVVGLAEGIKSIKSIPSFESVTIGHENVKVNGIDLSERHSNFGISSFQINYSFLTPWLALNEENHKKYTNLIYWKEKKALLEKILAGNIISMSKGLGYTVPEPIKANILKMQEVKTSLKGTPMIGFLGEFSVNFEIPDYWGIGKSVSRGFGTVKRINLTKI